MFSALRFPIFLFMRFFVGLVRIVSALIDCFSCRNIEVEVYIATIISAVSGAPFPARRDHSFPEEKKAMAKEGKKKKEHDRKKEKER